MAGGWRSEERAGGGSKDWCQHGVSECHDLLFRVTMSSEISQDSTPRSSHRNSKLLSPSPRAEVAIKRITISKVSVLSEPVSGFRVSEEGRDVKDPLLYSSRMFTALNLMNKQPLPFRALELIRASSQLKENARLSSEETVGRRRRGDSEQSVRFGRSWLARVLRPSSCIRPLQT